MRERPAADLNVKLDAMIAGLKAERELIEQAIQVMQKLLKLRGEDAAPVGKRQKDRPHNMAAGTGS